MQHCPLGHIRLRNFIYQNMESTDFPTGYDTHDYYHDEYTPSSTIKTTNTNSIPSLPVIIDTDFLPINPNPLPITRQNAFIES